MSAQFKNIVLPSNTQATQQRAFSLEKTELNLKCCTEI
jgi:hypothetical protein